MKKHITLLIDFDSTFVTIESLDKLAEIALQNRSDRESVIKKIKEITNLGMEGKISFPRSLASRLALFQPNKKHIDELIRVLQKSITPSFQKHAAYIQRHNNHIYILSSGFREYILPVATSFGIPENNVLANEFIFNKRGDVVGYNTEHLLAQEKGKVKMIESLHFTGPLYMVGDGFTDYEVKEAGSVDGFFAFTENVSRGEVVRKADVVAKNFTEVIANL